MAESDSDERTGAEKNGRTAGTSRWPSRHRWAQATLTGTITAIWYALPDYVSSRRARGWVKVALASVVVGWSLVGDASPSAERGAPAIQTAASSTPPETPSRPPSSDRVGWMGVAGAVGFVGLVVLGLVGAATLTFAFDRAVHRLGQRAQRRGALHPHTRNGVILGAVAALADLGAKRDGG